MSISDKRFLFVNKSFLSCDRAKVIAEEEMFETFLFLYDVLWLESTTLLVGGALVMS